MKLTNQSSLFPDQKGPGNYGNFYNTTSQPKEVVEKKRAINGGKNQQVLEVFANNPEVLFSPCDVWRILGFKGPITSIRRAVSDLTKGGFLEKTESTKIGYYGDPVHLWTISKN